jgi:hypothetical protein
LKIGEAKVDNIVAPGLKKRRLTTGVSTQKESEKQTYGVCEMSVKIKDEQV